jgi:hypothetical protein
MIKIRTADAKDKMYIMINYDYSDNYDEMSLKERIRG